MSNSHKGVPRPQYIRDKISQSHKERWSRERHPNCGRDFTQEHKDNISKGKKEYYKSLSSEDRKLSEEHKDKISMSRKKLTKEQALEVYDRYWVSGRKRGEGKVYIQSMAQKYNVSVGAIERIIYNRLRKGVY